MSLETLNSIIEREIYGFRPDTTGAVQQTALRAVTTAQKTSRPGTKLTGVATSIISVA